MKFLILGVVFVLCSNCSSFRLSTKSGIENMMLAVGLGYITSQENIKLNSIRRTPIITDMFDYEKGVGLIYFKSKKQKYCSKTSKRKGRRSVRTCREYETYYPILFLENEFYYFSSNSKKDSLTIDNICQKLELYYTSKKVDLILKKLVEGPIEVYLIGGRPIY